MNNTNNSIRVPRHLLVQAEALVPLLRQHQLASDVLGEEIGISSVLRAAMARGLRELRRVLEEENKRAESAHPYAGREVALSVVDDEEEGEQEEQEFEPELNR